MKKICKILNILVIAMALISLMSTINYASDETGDTITIEGVQGAANGFLERGKNGKNPIDIGEAKTQVGAIAGILIAVGEGILVIIALILGIKYITASPDEQAKIKKQIVGLAIAALVIFGAYEIWKIAYDTMSGVVG